MRIIRAGDCRRMPWKNGGGETTEIAVCPKGAGVEAFDWRLSMARVEADGPFSQFPGIDRTLSILSGEGLLLSVDGSIPFGLTGRSDPLLFPADVPTSATLIAGPVTDLNMMTRRDRCSHSVERLELSATLELAVDAVEILVFCAAGSVRIEAGDDVAMLEALDTIHLQPAPGALRYVTERAASLFLIRVWEAA